MRWENLLFDGIIFFFLIASGAGILELRDRAKKNKRALFHFFVLSLAIAWLTVFYGSFVEPRFIVTRNYDYPISSGSGENMIKAVVLGDFHLGPYNDEYLIDNVVRRVNRVRPDIIFLVGDFISFDNGQIDKFAKLGELQAPLGVFAVTGNHDYQGGGIDGVVEKLQKLNIIFLRNQGSTIKISGREFYIAGVDDYWFGNMDLTRALVGQRPGQSVILLAHNPDVVRYLPAPLRVDLLISGHTHGGQIRLPYIGSVVELPSDLPRTYARGLLEWKGKNMFVTPGLGEIGPRARLFDPPEISVLNISF
ncbi:MAG: metallophosphoesterase [Patescibacteria group bacterium]|nr:metallophosphoesterase [Patescibacteria group bacterium]